LGPEGVGLLATMDGIGAFVGALLLALWLTPRWYGRAYLGGVVCYLLTVVTFALLQSPVLAGAALLLTGLGGADLRRCRPRWSISPRRQKCARGYWAS
jgi:MFS family permease